jgi:hypothetical protein
MIVRNPHFTGPRHKFQFSDPQGRLEVPVPALLCYLPRLVLMLWCVHPYLVSTASRVLGFWCHPCLLSVVLKRWFPVSKSLACQQVREQVQNTGANPPWGRSVAWGWGGGGTTRPFPRQKCSLYWTSRAAKEQDIFGHHPGCVLPRSQRQQGTLSSPCHRYSDSQTKVTAATRHHSECSFLGLPIHLLCWKGGGGINQNQKSSIK